MSVIIINICSRYHVEASNLIPLFRSFLKPSMTDILANSVNLGQTTCTFSQSINYIFLQLMETGRYGLNGPIVPVPVLEEPR